MRAITASLGVINASRTAKASMPLRVLTGLLPRQPDMIPATPAKSQGLPSGLAERPTARRKLLDSTREYRRSWHAGLGWPT